MTHNDETNEPPRQPTIASPEVEPFPIVEFAESRTGRIPEDTSVWSWGVIEYGTAATPTQGLRKGDVITLDESVDQSVRLIVDGRVVAEGALVREDSRIGIRIARLICQELCDVPFGEEALDDAA